MAHKRKSGFYWVLLNEDKGWEVAEYFEELEQWQLIGTNISYYDNEFDTIDERHVLKSEYKNDFLLLDKGVRLNNPLLRDNEVILSADIKDLTRPMGLQTPRNFYDSTI